VSKVWLTDQDGLITSKRKGMAQVVKGFARQGGEDPEGEKLLESVKRVSSLQMGDHCVSCSKRKLFGALAAFCLFCFLCTPCSWVSLPADTVLAAARPSPVAAVDTHRGCLYMSSPCSC